jgi:hypothetical protein
MLRLFRGVWNQAMPGGMRIERSVQFAFGKRVELVRIDMRKFLHFVSRLLLNPD